MRAIAARDAGLALISQIRRWLVAGAVMLSGAFSLLAAQAFHGHARGAGASAAGALTAAGQNAGSGDEGSGLQQPAARPAPAPASRAPVVSGGS